MKAKIFRLKIVILCALLILLTHPAISSAQEIEITRTNFCLGIKGREPVDIVSEHIVLPSHRELFFWIEFQGGLGALKTLEATGQLLVKHQWRKGFIVTDTIEVGITIDKWREHRDAIRRFVRDQGYFTYRTYSFKANWKYGAYTVITLDNEDNAVARVGSQKLFRPKITIEK